MSIKRDYSMTNNFDWSFNLTDTEHTVWVPCPDDKGVYVVPAEPSPEAIPRFEKPVPLDPAMFPEHRDAAKRFDRISFFESTNFILTKLTELKLDAYIEYCRRHPREEEPMDVYSGNNFSPNSITSGYSTGCSDNSPQKDEAGGDNEEGKKKALCKFCMKNGEIQRIYEGHNTKDEQGNVICPILMKYVCEFCGATGAKAHTRKYCPENTEEGVKLPVLRLLANGNYSASHHHK